MTIETLKSPNLRNRNSISVRKSKFLNVSSINTLLAILKGILVCLFVCLFVSSMHNIQHVSVYDRKWLCFNHFHPCEPHSYIWSQSFLCCIKPFIFQALIKHHCKDKTMILTTTVNLSTIVNYSTVFSRVRRHLN